MSIPDAVRAKEVSDEYSDCIEAIEPDLFAWAQRREKLDRVFDGSVEEYRQAAAQLPADWEANAKAQFVVGRIMGSEPLARRFAKRAREDHPRHKQILRHMIAEPWFYALFRVEDRLGDNLLRVQDHISGQSMVLYSETVTRMHREGHRLFFSLLLSNPLCHQTYGIVYMYRGFTPEDFACFGRLLDPTLFESSGLAAIIGRDPIPFYLLYLFSSMPVVTHEDRPVVYCASELGSDRFDPERATIAAPSERKEGVTRWSLSDSESPFRFANLYWDKTKLTLMTSGIEEYSQALEPLRGQIAMPSVPQFTAGMLMVMAVEKILGISFPGSRYDTIFAAKVTPEESSEIERYNLFLRDLNEARNFGRSYDLHELARRHGVSESEADQFGAEMQRLDEKYSFSVKGGFQGYQPPPPAIRVRLAARLTSCDLFVLNESEEAASILRDYRSEYRPVLKNASRDTLELAELGDLLQNLYADLWQQEITTILTYTLWLLKTEGDHYLDVRDYAVEVLRTFGQLFVPRGDEKAIEDFIDFYGYFCFYALESFGLIEIEGEITQREVDHASYRMKAGPLFTAWITWKV